MIDKLNQYRFICLSILGMLICLISCQTDKSNGIPNPIEAQYFEDYESPTNKWGYIDTRGQVIIESKYDDARDFSCLRAAVNLNGKWGFIDRAGQLIIEPYFKQVIDFQNDRTFAQDFNLDWWLINIDGDTISKMQYDDFRPYINNLSVVNMGGSWGLIDTSGTEVLPTSYQAIKVLSADLFALKTDNQWTLQNRNFKKITSDTYQNIIAIDSNFIKFLNEGSWRIMDLRNLQASEGFKRISHVQNELCWAYDGIAYFLLDKLVATDIKINAEMILPGGSNLWRYKQDGQWGLINSQGNTVLPPVFEFLNAFSSSRAAFGRGNVWGYIDTKGSEVIPPSLPLAWDFKDGKARIIAYGGFGVIDTSGYVLVAPQFSELRDFYQGRARFQR